MRRRRPETFWVIGMIPVVLWFLGIIQISLETYIKFVLGTVIVVEVLGMIWIYLTNIAMSVNQDNVD